jgi:hypothetical protein
VHPTGELKKFFTPYGFFFVGFGFGSGLPFCVGAGGF